MWTEIPGLLLKFWREVLIVSLAIALSLSTLHGRALKAERDAKTAVIDSMRNAAEQYAEASANIAKEINDAHRDAVLAAEKNAFENAKRKFGKVVACPVRGLGTHGVLPPANTGEAGSTVEPDGPGEERLAVTREFVTDCGFDAGTVIMWQDWARRNQLPVGSN